MRHRFFQSQAVLVLCTIFALAALFIASYGAILDTTWTETQPGGASRVQVSYAGVQVDRSQDAWSGNGGRPSAGTNDWQTFPTKATTSMSSAIASRSEAEIVAGTLLGVAAPLTVRGLAPTLQKSEANQKISHAPAVTAKQDGSFLRLSWQGVGSNEYEIVASARIAGPYQQVQTLYCDADGELSSLVRLTADEAYFQVRLKNQ